MVYYTVNCCYAVILSSILSIMLSIVNKLLWNYTVKHIVYYIDNCYYAVTLSIVLYVMHSEIYYDMHYIYVLYIMPSIVIIQFICQAYCLWYSYAIMQSSILSTMLSIIIILLTVSYSQVSCLLYCQLLLCRWQYHTVNFYYIADSFMQSSILCTIPSIVIILLAASCSQATCLLFGHLLFTVNGIMLWILIILLHCYVAKHNVYHIVKCTASVNISCCLLCCYVATSHIVTRNVAFHCLILSNLMLPVNAYLLSPILWPQNFNIIFLAIHVNNFIDTNLYTRWNVTVLKG